MTQKKLLEWLVYGAFIAAFAAVIAFVLPPIPSKHLTRDGVQTTQGILPN